MRNPHMMLHLLAGGLVSLLILSGCSQPITGGLAADLTDLTAPHGVTVTNCRGVDLTRTGFCIVDAAAGDVARLVGGLNLIDMARAASPSDTVELSAWEAEGGCRQQAAFAESEPVQVYKSSRRPASLVGSNGTAFTYLIVYFRDDTDQACLQASYTSG